ncbi:DUF4932 domain-containing protein [Flavobacterium sp.]|uniref:DUF4932 domain-containing protein n=1 Tax=Flavobacterium sp. TaxID=239 RepID=UPI0026353F6A|nr:DUF4932 domain-containing protein [Flavobacterium sp.]
MKNLFLVLSIFLSTLSFAQVEVKVDNRIEAVSIFYAMAIGRDSLDVKPTPSIYLKDFDTYFKPYKNHKSLNWYRNLDQWDAPNVSTIGLYLTETYPFKLKIPYQGDYIKSSKIEDFIIHLNSFYKDCNVSKFIKKHQKLYKKTSLSALDTIIKSDVLKETQKFFKSETNDKFIIYIDLLNNHTSNSIEIKEYKNCRQFKLAYLSSENPNSTNEESIKFVPAFNVVIHECSHLYVSDFISANYDRLFKIKNKFLTKPNGKNLSENKWQDELDEMLVRVCVAKILGNKYGSESEQSEIENQSRGYLHFKGLRQFITEKIEKNPNYNSFKDFYPDLVLFLENLK